MGKRGLALFCSFLRFFSLFGVNFREKRTERFSPRRAQRTARIGGKDEKKKTARPSPQPRRGPTTNKDPEGPFLNMGRTPRARRTAESWGWANGKRQTTMTNAMAHKKAGRRRIEARCTQRPLKKQHVPFFALGIQILKKRRGSFPSIMAYLMTGSG